MPRPARRSPAARPSTPPDHQNRVQLVGRLSAIDARILPSGDHMVALRVVVDRGRASGAGPTVDTIDCTVWRAGLRRRVLAWQVGEHVEVDGALRRRFWRGPGGTRSRYDVEVSQVRRVR
jgi:single-strand DNA-binding protein